MVKEYFIVIASDLKLASEKGKRLIYFLLLLSLSVKDLFLFNLPLPSSFFMCYLLCRVIWNFTVLSCILWTPSSSLPLLFLLHQKCISREEMLTCVNSSKSIMWLISGILFLELGSCMSTAGWGTWTSDMFTDWERFLPLSQGIQVRDQVV